MPTDTRLPAAWEMDQGTEAMLEATEAGWAALSESLRDAVTAFVARMGEILPGMLVGLEFLEDGRVKVKLYPPRDHPAYHADRPGEYLGTVFGVSK